MTWPALWYILAIFAAVLGFGDTLDGHIYRILFWAFIAMFVISLTYAIMFRRYRY